MKFGVLGSLEVLDDAGAPVDLGGSQSRTILAVLLVAAGRVVTAESILDVVWGEDPPASAAGTLQSYISRLRRVLEPGCERARWPRSCSGSHGGTGWPSTPPRWTIAASRPWPTRGGRLAAGRMDEARDVLVEADRLWRGPALVEYRDREFAMGLAARLEERRLAAVENRVAADLALGRHAALVGELAELVRPTRCGRGCGPNWRWRCTTRAARPRP